MKNLFTVVILLISIMATACGSAGQGAPAAAPPAENAQEITATEPPAPTEPPPATEQPVTKATDAEQAPAGESLADGADCLPHETYDPATDSCYVDISCDTEEECDAIITSLYEGYDVELEAWEMTAKDCMPGESYDPQEKACYIECDTDEECQALADEIYGGTDIYFDDSFSGHPAGPPPSAAGCDAQGDDEAPPIACYGLDQNLDISPISVNEYETDPAYTDPERHRQIWNFTRSILPKTILKEETRQYHIFTDGPDETLAFVSPLPDDPYHWFVAVDIEDAPNPIGPDKEFVHTIIHEFAHILTLRSAQVPPDPDAGTGAMEDDSPTETELNCPNFFTGEGCAGAQSYINLFFDRFWADIYDEFLGLDAAETEEEYSDLAYEFYQTYQDRFVTEYAATNPGEDIAESFTFFVLKDKPAGNSIADQKVHFFYAFPELVKMRNQIRGQLARAGR